MFGTLALTLRALLQPSAIVPGRDGNVQAHPAFANAISRSRTRMDQRPVFNAVLPVGLSSRRAPTRHSAAVPATSSSPAGARAVASCGWTRTGKSGASTGLAESCSAGRRTSGCSRALSRGSAGQGRHALSRQLGVSFGGMMGAK
jgi:hypothetical protein